MDETNDMTPTDPEKDISAALESHLRPLMQEKDLKNFREQLPVEFVKDASEGLDLLKNKAQLESVLRKLNQQLHHQVKHKVIRKKSRAIGNFTLTYWAIIITILLSVAAFIVIRMALHKA